MLRSLLPRDAVVVETPRPSPWEDTHCEGDEALREARLCDFRVGRACAARALRALGVQASIGRGSSGEPLWPDGVAGSITHCADYAAAAVTDSLPGLGIDVERNVALAPGVIKRIAAPSELTVENPALVFSAKESIFKAVFPILRRRLGFLDVTVDFDLGRCTFGACIDGLRLHGRFATSATHVFTSVVLRSTEAHMPRT